MTTSAPKLEYDVIVIGAGVAGLAAAQTIKKALPTVSLLVLEARDRIGGRVHTIRDGTIAMDMGATWIHGHKANPMVKIAKKIGTKLALDGNDDIAIFDEQGEELSDDEWDKGEEEFEDMIEDAKRYAKSLNGKHISLKEAIEHVKPDALHDPVIQYFISHNVEFDYGGSIESLSAAYYDDDGQLQGVDAIPIGGFEPIIQELAKGLNIQKLIEVQSICYTTEGARLETNTGVVYKADKVVCMLPLGVLKSGDVDFHPLLLQQK
jgi:protoporphyrinogen oxidase